MLHIPPTSLPLRASRYSWGPTGTSEHLWGINRLHFSSPTRPKLQPTSLWLSLLECRLMPCRQIPRPPIGWPSGRTKKAWKKKKSERREKRNGCSFIIPLLNPRVNPYVVVAQTQCAPVHAASRLYLSALDNKLTSPPKLPGPRHPDLPGAAPRMSRLCYRAMPTPISTCPTFKMRCSRSKAPSLPAVWPKAHR